MINLEEKKLNIIVVTDGTSYGEAALSHGTILAAIFKASLTIITDFSFSKVHSDKHASFTDEAEKTLLAQTEHAARNRIKTFVLSERFYPDKLYRYAEETNTFMFVIGVEKKGKETFFSRKKAIRFIRPSRIPVMTVGNIMPDKSVYQHVILPLDIDRQAKEKSLWAGYFSRFYCATIHVLYTSYKDAFLRKKLKDNVDFTEKLYHNLEITYQLHQIKPTVDNMDRYSLQYAAQLGASLTVIMMTKYYSLADYLMGPKENAVIGNESGFPVLCINERDDLYVLCT